MTPQQGGFSPRGTQRVSRAANQVERFDRGRGNGTGPRSFAADPKQRVGYVVRVTDQPSPGAPALYPGLVVELDSVSGGTPAWSDGEKCWVIRPFGDDSEVETDFETPAAPVGVNDDDGLLVFVIAPIRTGREATPLNPMPCLVVDGGEVVGLAQLWYDPETGEGLCRTSGTCGCPPSEPPSPETSCCPLWYCTPDGPVEVTADENGKYTPPEDWDGSPPHLTEAEAEEACPTPPLELSCANCEEPYTVPPDVVMSFANTTGNVVPILPNSVVLPGTEADLINYEFDSGTVEYTLHVNCLITGGVQVIMRIVTTGGVRFFGLSSTTGWSYSPASGPDAYLDKFYSCGDEINFNEHVGTATFTGGGTADVYLST